MCRLQLCVSTTVGKGYGACTGDVKGGQGRLKTGLLTSVSNNLALSECELMAASTHTLRRSTGVVKGGSRRCAGFSFV